MTSRTVKGRKVALPVEVRDASAGTATFLANWDAAGALLPAGLSPLRVTPRHTLVTLVMVEYRDNDLGAYDEVAVQLIVGRPGPVAQSMALGRALRGRPDTFTVAMPVNQSFTLAAGREIWGFPKSLDDVQVETGDARARGTWRADGLLVLDFSVPVGRSRAMPLPPLTAWTMLGGVLSTTAFAMSSEHGRIGRGGVELTLGEHPFADVLRSLGLPRRSLMTTWMDDARASFGEPRPA